MINHLNLVYFITAARELNFTRAAEKLFISQQALSNHIASLEKDEISLIDRKTPMKLTAAGEIFYKYAVQMEDSYQAMLQEISEVKGRKAWRADHRYFAHQRPADPAESITGAHGAVSVN